MSSNYRNTTIGFGVEPQSKKELDTELRDKLAVIGLATVLAEVEGSRA